MPETLSDKKVVFFSPFSNIWVHSLAESLLASGLKKFGWRVSRIYCNGLLDSFCVAMSEAGLNELSSAKQKSQICKACKKRRDLLGTSFQFTSTFLEDFVFESDVLEANRILESVTPATWQTLEVLGVPLGKFAIYELWLSRKLISEDLDPEIWQLYLNQLKNTLITFYSALRYLEQHRPSAVIVYNNRYSVNHAFCAAAKYLAINSYSIHGGWHIERRPTSLSMMRLGVSMQTIFDLPGWKEAKKQPITNQDSLLVKEHFQGLWDASSAFAYSSKLKGSLPSELRATFKIPHDSKVLLATMSSEDEILGARLIGASIEQEGKDSVFKNQIKWIESLISFAAARKDLHLIVRLHPRMFPNKRESVTSPTIAEINRLIKIAPSNVSFNVPSDNVGLYDLVQIVDVLLNYSSSVGAEIAALGLEVVAPLNNKFETYPSEINSTGNNAAEYFKLIDEAIQRGWSLENARTAFRWFSFLFSKVSQNFDDISHTTHLRIRPKKPGIALAVWKKLVYYGLNFGPLLLERRSLRKAFIADSKIAVFDDALTNSLLSISESGKWAPVKSSIHEEELALKNFFQSLCENEWAHITEPRSLAEKVRAALFRD